MPSGDIAIRLRATLAVLTFSHPSAAFADGHGALVETEKAWEATLNGTDAGAVAAHFLPDARLLAPDGPAVEGIGAIQGFWAGLIEGPPRTIELGLIDVGTFGETAIEIGTWSAVIPDADGEETTSSGRTLVLWKLGGDGSWRMSQDMLNSGH